MRVEVVLYVVPRGLHLVARDAERLRDIAELVLAELAEVVGDDLLDVRRHRLADLLEVLHLDQHAFADIARADAPRLDGLDRAQRAHRVGHRHLHRGRRVLDRDQGIEIADLVDVADEVLGYRKQTGRQENAHVPRQPFGEGLLGLGAHDRIEFVSLVVALHEARALEWLGLGIVLSRSLRETEAVEANTPGKRLPAQRTDLLFLEIERRILQQLGIDDFLELQRRKLEDRVRGDLFWRDLQLLLRH